MILVSLARIVLKSNEHKNTVTSGVTSAGGRVPPETSDREISAELPGKKRQGKRGEIEKKRRKIVKGKVENRKRIVEKLQTEERTPLFFSFSLFKMTKISFGSTKMEIFYREKAFDAGKKIRKNAFAPSEKIFLLRPDCYYYALTVIATIQLKHHSYNHDNWCIHGKECIEHYNPSSVFEL